MEHLDNMPDESSADEEYGMVPGDPVRAVAGASSIGGYDYKFVTDLPDALQCLICTVAAMDPLQVDCCGKIYCKNCLDRLKRSRNSSCPNCRSNKWKSFPDKKSDRDIKSLKVKCNNLDMSGCTWMGELRQLQEHIAKCSGVFQPCKYASIGCTVKKFKKELPAHEDECTTEHLKLSLEMIARLEIEVKKLQVNSEKLSRISNGISLAPLTFRFPNFKVQSRLMAREKVAWESPSFYSHPCGYKFHLRLQFEIVPVFSLSVLACLTKGEHDNNLEWPFRGTIKFEALNQECDMEHLQGVARFKELRETQRNCRVPDDLERNEMGWGMSKFIYCGGPAYEEYLTNGSLYIRVSSVQVSEMNKFWLLDNLVA